VTVWKYVGNCSCIYRIVPSKVLNIWRSHGYVTSLMTWIDRFLDAAKRRGARPRTIQNYSEILRRITNHQQLNLETCSEQELLSFLDRSRETHKTSTYTVIVIVIKMALRFLGREDLAESFQCPKQKDPAATIKVLSPEEVEKLIREAPRLQDRLLVELFYETGARHGEIANLSIRDIQFDEYGAIIYLHGKTGSRRRRVYTCVADLREHINNHPLRDRPNAPLFISPTGVPYHNLYDTIYRRIKVLGKRILRKEIYPHEFRHTKATEDSRYFTDREMMALFGWKGPQMVGVYSHLSMRDVEDKDLVLHGLKRKEEILRPISQVVKCVCGQENAPIAVYCVGCGALLASAQMADLANVLSDPKFIQSLINSESFKDALRKALGE